MDHKQTVLAATEEEVVVVADLHSLNGLAVRLYLIDFSELRHLEYVNGTRFPFLADSGNQCLLIGREDDLRELNAGIKPILVVLAVPYLAVVADGVHLEGLSGDVHDRGEVDVLLVEVLVVQALLVLLLHDKVVEVDVAVDTARGETRVVLEPVDAAHLVHVTLALVVLRAVLSVEIVHPDRIVANGTGKQVPTMRKLDFSAGLDLEGTWLR